MTLQQWGFSFKGRIGRREFWIGIGICFALIFILLTLHGMNVLPMNFAAVCTALILYPTAAIFSKRLHDRNKRGGWALLLILAWFLLSLDWNMLAPIWQWGIGRFIPTLIFVMIILDCGVFRGTEGANRFGESAEMVEYISAGNSAQKH
ncbi:MULTISPECIES: DUF805 domain-containing protein [Xenorhabdus]|uniref:DUF805 domain-containing protein n=1 Tax=Xenorhabdus stockiae TaxID=351614 RepID=A0A2D0KLG6_9GAMM|nr:MULTISPECIES: DUF805 domain-containing protein [Xenorhabdus]MCC8365041.1 DUF805 domain-containing protein [Xenorhabdus sp. PB61.4]MCC8379723.1 DUF805 domain-containing protein [Xenorhabdus sp. PB30.3]PHM58595.1 hypothetical protein Xekk_01170 [Xenorhabdus sp. KK7.4]PHM64284.1 hypothetical protein Xsto_03127 [Xenorhabdus stockiae]PHM68353.1 hypothetical protein Xekj_03402 [Xenorhabdus sp. KJ12.1]